jgi:hypothetical protein
LKEVGDWDGVTVSCLKADKHDYDQDHDHDYDYGYGDAHNHSDLSDRSDQLDDAPSPSSFPMNVMVFEISDALQVSSRSGRCAA